MFRGASFFVDPAQARDGSVRVFVIAAAFADASNPDRHRQSFLALELWFHM
jgi:hypothetical protein